MGFPVSTSSLKVCEVYLDGDLADNAKLASVRCTLGIAKGRVMEMHEIRYFLAACQTLNFHRASDLVHVGQPALTRAIQKLEAELGGPLFHRDKGHVQLTEFGSLTRDFPNFSRLLRSFNPKNATSHLCQLQIYVFVKLNHRRHAFSRTQSSFQFPRCNRSQIFLLAHSHH